MQRSKFSRLSAESKPASGNGTRPQTLARRACDACRARRRKCVFPSEAATGTHPQIQCNDCTRLGLTCSFLVPTRRRGPKQRNLLSSITREIAEEEDCIGDSNIDASSHQLPGSEWQFEPRAPTSRQDGPNSIVSVVGHSSPYQHSHLGLDGASPGIPNQYVSPSISDLPFPTDELCSRALLDIVIGDYLDRIYPLVPVIHRPSFRADLTSNRDRTDPDFLSLVISIAALTVGLLPSRFLDYRAMAPDIAMRFETRTAMINCCSDMCMRLRTHTYWDHISQRKWAACYLLSIAFFQTGQTNRSRMHEVESLQIGRLLGLHRISDYVGLNCIETQLRKKAFWLSFYTYAHSTLQSGRRERLAFLDHSMLHEVNFEALLPREDDDEQILEDQILSPLSLIASPPVPGSESEPRSSVFTLTTGFIFHSRLFLKGLEEAVSPENCDCAHRQNPSLKLSRLRKLLHEIRYLLDEVPGPMRQWASADILDTADHPSPGVNSNPCSPMPQLSNQYRKSADQHYGTSKVFLGQAEIMRANLHGTHLWLQSLLLDQIDALLQGTASTDDSTTGENSSMAVLKSNWTEREDICRQMLHLLHSIPFAHLEPNGLYLTYKVRDVAVGLLNCPYEPHERAARRAAEYVRDFTRALSRLDRSEKVNTNSLRSWVDIDRERARP